jgi:3-hydroxyisobutyrate dehydrogenase
MSDHVQCVAVLGTGTMGAPMARNLLRAGFGVRVWNRTMAKAAALVADGARLAVDPAHAATGADVLITMLTDGATVEDAMTGPNGALSRLRPGAVWIQMSTVGVEWANRLADLADLHGIAFVDAPVSGSSEPAENGELEVLAGGAGQARPRVEPIFDVSAAARCGWIALATAAGSSSRSITGWLSPSRRCPKRSHSAKRSAWSRTSSLTIAGGPRESVYAMTKGTAMLDEDFVAGFPLRHAAKDAELAMSAAHRHGTELTLTEALLPRWREAIAEGHGDDDVAAAVTQSAVASL